MAGLERRLARLESQLRIGHKEPPRAPEWKYSDEEIVEVLRILHEIGTLETVLRGNGCDERRIAWARLVVQEAAR